MQATEQQKPGLDTTSAWTSTRSREAPSEQGGYASRQALDKSRLDTTSAGTSTTSRAEGQQVQRLGDTKFVTVRLSTAHFKPSKRPQVARNLIVQVHVEIGSARGGQAN